MAMRLITTVSVAFALGTHAQQLTRTGPAVGDFIGYGVEDGTAVTGIYCPTRGNDLIQTDIGDLSSVLRCDQFDIYTGEIGVGCLGSTEWIYTSSSAPTASESIGEWVRNTRDCSLWNCVTVSVFDSLDSTNEPRLLIGCEDSIGLTDTRIASLYVEAPTTVSSGMTRETGSSPTRQTSSGGPQETGNGANGDVDNGDSDSGPSAGVIAGAVVGGVAGLALIAGLVYLAYSMGKKRRAAAAEAGVEGGSGGSGSSENKYVYTGHPDNIGPQSSFMMHADINQPRHSELPSGYENAPGYDNASGYGNVSELSTGNESRPVYEMRG
ncbi:hypothetical protein B0I35DRAFT_403865 [Stachybotrys elegans]|uniref:Mid2 domain-containing protein n=1 Tax=Stachybotrys elegans TaxID=80388 RepID=A0A8K0T7E4_9HYPO|nr:hypothetical protein B0I35DRAFT_403865 [Stachybotrys elegans]